MNCSFFNGLTCFKIIGIYFSAFLLTKCFSINKMQSSIAHSVTKATRHGLLFFSLIEFRKGIILHYVCMLLYVTFKVWNKINFIKLFIKIFLKVETDSVMKGSYFPLFFGDIARDLHMNLTYS